MKKIVFIFVLLISDTVLSQKSPVFELNDNFVSIDLVGFVSRYDSENKDSIEQISYKDFQLLNEIPSFQADKKYHWLKIPLISPTNKKLILEYQQIFIDEIAFFLFENDSLKQQNQSSWELNFSKKPFPSRYHAFEFEVKQNKTYSIFLRCYNSKSNYSNRAFLRLFDANNYEKAEDAYLLQLSLSVGCLLFVTLLSIGFFVYSKKRIYIFYACYIASISIYILIVNGVFNQFFNPQSDLFAQPEFGSLLVVFNLVFHLLYIYEFFKIKQKTLKLAFISFFLLSIIQVFQIIFNPQNHIPFGFVYLYFSLLIIIALFLNFKPNRTAVFLYLVASGPVFLTFIFVILGAIGFTKINSFFYYYAHIPLAFEGIGLGLALLYQFNNERRKIELELEKNRIETTQKILLAQEEERQRLALDLHDDLGGSLSVLNRELDELSQKNGNILSNSVSLTQKIVSDLRTVSHHLMPSAFESKGLKKVVEETIDMANRQSKVNFVFVCNGEEKRLSLDTEINIYRIIKELINNILKHSEAKQAIVQMIYFEDFLYVSVEDDGKGFDFESKENWGIGFKNINLRTNYLNAKLTTESSPDGTLISIEIPYNAPKSKDSARR